MRIAICDDDTQFTGVLESAILQKKNSYQNLAIEVYFSGKELCDAMHDGVYYDVIFSDIRMRRTSGIELGHYLRHILENSSTQLVYVSNYETYHKELYPVSPTAFVSKAAFEEDIENAFRLLNQRQARQQDAIFLKMGRETRKIRKLDVLYLESYGRKVLLHALSYQLEFYITMPELLDLCGNDFMQIHKSYIVNLNHVAVFSPRSITMQNGCSLPVGPSFVNPAKNKVTAYLRGKLLEYA